MTQTTAHPQDVGTSGTTGGFVHLHLHTEYSLLDGGNKIGPLVKQVKKLGMNAVAVTDHGNLHGAIEFYGAARAAGIKPILGIEAYVAAGDRTEKKHTGVADGGFHLVLLAENEIGWRNLLWLSSDAFRNGFYYKPRMDKSTLTERADGLIAINGHLGSSIAHHLVQYERSKNEQHFEDARAEAEWHKAAFGTNEAGEPRFFIELQRHGVEQQERINPHLVRLARETDLPLICDNDAHFLRAEDHDAHDSLCCISMQKTKDDPARLKYPTQLYVKSPEQMRELFEDLPEAVDNSVRIAERCNVDVDFDANHAPVVKIVSAYDRLPDTPDEARALAAAFECGEPIGSTAWYKAFCDQFTLEPFDTETDTASPDQLKRDCDAALRMLSEAGAIWRYGQGGVDASIRARLDRELGILADKLISAYFLIVWDFVNWARHRDIPANARGSGVGTMVGYVLGLSNACPVKYGLLFERFTDPDRSEYPDIDIDICQDGRGDVINYVREKYGYVAQIITFGRLKARAAIKDVARVNGFSAVEGQRLANLVPNELNITLAAALEKDPDFRAEYDNDERVRTVIDTARALENHARHAGVHAAGVVVATQPLENIVPLCRATGNDDVVTQWDGPTCEGVGLLKMDFLGLRTLTTLETAMSLIRETLDEDAIWSAVGRTADDGGAHPLDLDRLQYEDQRVLGLFCRADTSGVFQFESGGMRKLLLDMQPDRLEDLIAANALFRPGPMDLIPEYCMRKHGKQPVPTVHEIVDGHTAETYGIMVYQEQVMQIVHDLGEVPLRQAYTLIKAISKKKHAVIDAERPKFIDGAKAKGLSEKQANDLFDLILKFAGYGFNKSHSTGYAIIAYQTAYLKTYFPAQYMAAVLTCESGARKVDEWAPYLVDCRHTVFPDDTPEKPHRGIEVKPPDLNRSRADFSVVFDPDETRDALHGHIRFGLGAIKGVGRAAIRGILEARERDGDFESIFDFCERVTSRVANKAAIEALVKSGAFDPVHEPEYRSAVLAAIDDAISAGQQAAEDRRAGQMSIFGEIAADEPTATQPERPLPSVPPWDQMTMLANEKETLGIHVSGHPIDYYADLFNEYVTADIRALAELANETPVIVGGMLTRVRLTVVRNGRSAGEKMAMITVQDQHASIDGVVFSNVFAKYAARLQDSALVLLAGRIDQSRGSAQIIVDRVVRPEDAPRELATHLDLVFREDAVAPNPPDAPDPPHAPDASDRDAGVVSRMELAAGLLRQGRATTLPGKGQSVEVVITVHTGGKRVQLQNPWRVALEPTVLCRLEDLLGPNNVRVRCSGPPVVERKPARRGRPVSV